MIFSVVTPTFNRANKLHRVFNSINNQTLKKIDDKYIFEWIIIDDGSTDSTKELVKKWQKEVDWPIIYIYQENKGKAQALVKGIEITKGELTLIADSDDEFLPETFETFYNIWNSFSNKEKDKCSGIAVLCKDQFGNRVGCNFPKEGVVLLKESVFKWKNLPLGETWAAINSKNLKKYFVIPEEAKKLKFIPESFFWDKIAFNEINSFSYVINKVLRIYYKKEDDNISNNIRQKYPEGFLFESKWFVTKYLKIAWRYPKVYLKHIIKLIYFSWKVRNGAR
ncbi:MULTISPECIES: glycosyltransferase family A protein [unclassified Lebetimonas]|uniref:glycosyltransferase family A protein n=1 Tax=unclassified Lebetimonas TaxID=2648158 RepID=UPI00046329B0|nr:MULTISPECIES: glycosyltransferase family 2 protein [unclassified Lebetimonas]